MKNGTIQTLVYRIPIQKISSSGVQRQGRRRMEGDVEALELVHLWKKMLKKCIKQTPTNLTTPESEPKSLVDDLL